MSATFLPFGVPLINLTHAPFAQHAQHLIAADGFACQRAGVLDFGQLLRLGKLVEVEVEAIDAAIHETL
ncbi:MAG: hypothetical protein U0694_18380 [Anaerolineae bacterium]